MGRDRMNSMIVPHGVTVKLWDSSYFTGESWTVVGEETFGSETEMNCVNHDDFADRVNSISVYNTNPARGGKAFGEWKMLASAPQITYEIKTHFETSNTTSTTSQESITLSQEMKAGIEFESETITETLALQLTEYTEATYGMSIEETISITCGVTDGSAMYGLWQWVTMTNDKLSKALTSLSICRTGDGVWN